MAVSRARRRATPWWQGFLEIQSWRGHPEEASDGEEDEMGLFKIPRFALFASLGRRVQEGGGEYLRTKFRASVW